MMGQADPGGPRKSQEELGGARRSQEEPGGARRGQEKPEIHCFCFEEKM